MLAWTCAPGTRIWNEKTLQARFSFEHWLAEVVHKPCKVVDCSLQGRCHKAGLLTLAGNRSAHEAAARRATAVWQLYVQSRMSCVRFPLVMLRDARGNDVWFS